MEFSNAYLDLDDNPCALTAEELAYFQETVDCVRAALGVDVEITNRDHYRELDGKHREALGIFYTNDPKNPAEDCFITIDNSFIHDCYRDKFFGEWNLNFESLEHAICHEIAHMTKWRHGKGHTRLTEELFARVEEYQKEKEQEVTRDSGGNGTDNTVWDIEKVYEGEDGMIYSVGLDEDRSVDVKVCPDGLVYTMENEDGSTVYWGDCPAYGTCPGFQYDEDAVIQFVKDVYKKENCKSSLEEQIKNADSVKQGQVEKRDDLLRDKVR